MHVLATPFAALGDGKGIASALGVAGPGIEEEHCQDDGKLRKRHGLQGPIDDAFMDRFVMVRPTGAAFHEKAGHWADGELRHAVDHWRR